MTKGQYDYRGTAQSRMYDWLVTREGVSLSLCILDMEEVDKPGAFEIEKEDLEYIRGLVERDREYHFDPQMEQLKHELVPKDPPQARSGGVDYYDPDGPNALPEPLGAPPSSTRAGVDAREEAIDAEA